MEAGEQPSMKVCSQADRYVKVGRGRQTRCQALTDTHQPGILSLCVSRLVNAQVLRPCSLTNVLGPSVSQHLMLPARRRRLPWCVHCTVSAVIGVHIGMRAMRMHM